MKALINLVALALIVFGGFVLYKGGFTYNTKEQIAQVGDVKVTQDQEKGIYFPTWAGGAALGIGVLLLAGSVLKKN